MSDGEVNAKTGKVRVVLSLDPDEVAALRKVADEGHRSPSGAVVALLEAQLQGRVLPEGTKR